MKGKKCEQTDILKDNKKNMLRLSLDDIVLLKEDNVMPNEVLAMVVVVKNK